MFRFNRPNHLVKFLKLSPPPALLPPLISHVHKSGSRLTLRKGRVRVTHWGLVDSLSREQAILNYSVVAAPSSGYGNRVPFIGGNESFGALVKMMWFSFKHGGRLHLRI